MEQTSLLYIMTCYVYHSQFMIFMFIHNLHPHSLFISLILLYPNCCSLALTSARTSTAASCWDRCRAQPGPPQPQHRPS